MTLTVITEAAEIARYHEELGRLMRISSTGRARKLLYTTRGGNDRISVYHNPENNLWWSNARLSKDNKYYNLIGLNPDFERANHILIQINYQIQFNTFREAAFWAKDNRGKVFLMHNGKMGGGAKGFTYENIDYYYTGSRADIVSNEYEFESYIVCELHSRNAYKQVIDFVQEIERIKNIINDNEEHSSVTGRSKPSPKLKKYSPEFWGKRKSYLRKGRVESDSDHGLIVHSLKNELETNFGLKGKVFNNKLVDLGVVKNNKPVAIFEVKPGTNMYSIYTAVGQLMLHAHSFKTKPAKFIVLPDELDVEIENDFGALGISTIRFIWKRDKIQFTNLNSYF